MTNKTLETKRRQSLQLSVPKIHSSPIGNTKPYFKAAFEGEPGTGKSWSAALVAIGLHKKIKSKKPIVLIDTEKAAKFLVPLFKEHGIEAMVRETHSLADLVTAMKLCSEGYSDIMVIDSITHIWMDFQEAYKRKLNRQTFQIQDWMAIKSDWNRNFSIPLVQSPLHIIATGRVSDRMEQEVDEDGRKEFTKTGVKMQAEKNVAYEFDVWYSWNATNSSHAKARGMATGNCPQGPRQSPRWKGLQKPNL
jgi:hypothetical protein